MLENIVFNEIVKCLTKAQSLYYQIMKGGWVISRESTILTQGIKPDQQDLV